MDYNQIFKILGEEWQKLEVHTINDIPHWVGFEVVALLGLSNSTSTFRGPKYKPKMKFPLYRKKFMPKVNRHRSIYMVTLEAIILTIKRTKKCWRFRVVLRESGYKFH